MLIQIDENQDRLRLLPSKMPHYIIVSVTSAIIIAWLILVIMSPKQASNSALITTYGWLKICFPTLLLLPWLIRSLLHLRSEQSYLLDRTHDQLRHGQHIVASLHDIEGVEIQRKRNGGRNTLIEQYTYVLQLRLANGRRIPLATSAFSLQLGGGESEVREIARRVSAYLNILCIDETEHGHKIAQHLS